MRGNDAKAVEYFSKVVRLSRIKIQNEEDEDAEETRANLPTFLVNLGMAKIKLVRKNCPSFCKFTSLKKAKCL